MKIWTRILLANTPFLLFLSGCGGTNPDMAGELDGPRAELALVSHTDSIEPGVPFLVGARFRIRDGWHIHGADSGDAGLPTRLRLTAPEGFARGEVEYPAARRFESPGGIVTFGYEREVVLAVAVTPPGALEPGTPVQLRAEGSWLACKDICVKESGTASLTLPVVRPGHPARRINEKLFAAFASRTAFRSEGDSR